MPQNLSKADKTDRLPYNPDPEKHQNIKRIDRDNMMDIYGLPSDTNIHITGHGWIVVNELDRQHDTVYVQDPDIDKLVLTDDWWECSFACARVAVSDRSTVDIFSSSVVAPYIASSISSEHI